MSIADPKIDYVIAHATRAILVERFPLCFVRSGGVKKPLKIGIKQDLRREARDLKPFALHCVLTDYTRGPHYLMCLVTGAPRFDLQGNEAGIVSANDTAFAALRAAGARHDNAIMDAIRDSGITIAAIEAGVLREMLVALSTIINESGPDISPSLGSIAMAQAVFSKAMRDG